MSSTRREVLLQIAVTPLAAAQQHPAHQGPAQKTAVRPHQRRYFTEHELQTLRVLSDWILPPDERSGGGVAAGTAEFVDVMAAADAALGAAFTGGIAWLDAQMRRRHGRTFRECGPEEQRALLDRIAWRGKAEPELAAGVSFFALLRAWTVDAFYSSRAGVQDLGYLGNTAVAEFPGCPEAVVKQMLDRAVTSSP